METIKNDDKFSDNDSNYSDISNSTDLKVFNGAINKQMKILKKLEDRLSHKDKNNIIYDEEKIAVNSNNKNTNKKGKEIKKNLNYYSNNKLKFIQSSAKKTLDINDNYNINTNNINNNNLNINAEILSFRNDKDTVRLNEINNNVDNESNIQMVTKFKKTSEKDKEIINNNYIEKENNENNFNSEINYCDSQITFTIADIKSGFVLLVNTDDIIFTLPTILFPKKIAIGDTFSFEIEETNQSFVNKNEIAILQRNYLRDYLK